MYCPKCGKQLDSSKVQGFCPYCGGQLKPATQPEQRHQQPQYQNQQVTQTAPGATAGLSWGIIGLIFGGVLFGIIAIVQGNKAKKLIRENPGMYTGSGNANAAVIIGVIDIVFFFGVKLPWLLY